MAISTKDNNTLKKQESSLGNMLKGTGLFIGIYCILHNYNIFDLNNQKIKYLPFL